MQDWQGLAQGEDVWSKSPTKDCTLKIDSNAWDLWGALAIMTLNTELQPVKLLGLLLHLFLLCTGFWGSGSEGELASPISSSGRLKGS